jgi:geranylgeranyl diphosphate synthase type I
MTLIHDDIEDKSELRRGKPCIHRIYGIPTAINAGDAMLIKVFEIANSSNIPLDRRHELVAYIAKRAYDLTWGQAFEFSMWRRKDFRETDVIRLLRSKTGALTGLSAESGAIAGGATEAQLKSLGEFGETVGIAFQIVDDILNVTADAKEYGKEFGGDIREGKKTVLAAHLMSQTTVTDRRAFVKLLGKSSITPSEIRKVVRLYQKYDSLFYAEHKAKAYLESALKSLDPFPDNDSKKALVTVAEFLVSRKY